MPKVIRINGFSSDRSTPLYLQAVEPLADLPCPCRIEKLTSRPQHGPLLRVFNETAGYMGMIRVTPDPVEARRFGWWEKSALTRTLNDLAARGFSGTPVADPTLVRQIIGEIREIWPRGVL